MPESTMTINKEGIMHWRNEEGQLHREDGPAIEWADGRKHWCQNGKLHRLDGPAIEHQRGGVMWYIHGDYLGMNLTGFWKLWNHLDDEGRQNVNLHMWLRKLTNV